MPQTTYQEIRNDKNKKPKFYCHKFATKINMHTPLAKVSYCKIQCTNCYIIKLQDKLERINKIISEK